MIKAFKDEFRQHAVNLLGWRSDRKIIVIESDDWGTVRMQSKRAFDFFLNKGYPVDECGYNRNDSLESNDDVTSLLTMLQKTGKETGKHLKFTLNNIVANPDFKKIQDSQFSEYFYEPFSRTLERYPSSDNVLTTYGQGIHERLIYPQLHGREHVNITKWLDDLKAGNLPLQQAFDFEMFSVHASKKPIHIMEYMDALSSNQENQYAYFEPIMRDADALFQQTWGFQSKTFIAPCFTWHADLNPLFVKLGIKGLQGQYYQVEPTKGKAGFEVTYHFTGKRLMPDLRYLMRNVTFEPSLATSSNVVSKALKEIDTAFFWNRPAIISTHRVNYVGRINESNRRNGLRQLHELLLAVVNKYPNVEFMFSNELLNEMNKESK